MSITRTTSPTEVCHYSPYEILELFRNHIDRGKTNNVVWLRGIYVQRPNQNRNWNTAFDELRDVDSNATITLKINWQDRDKLKNNSLAMVGGLIDPVLFLNGNIQVTLHVTRFEVIQDHFLTEQDMRRMELKQLKAASKYKNVKMEIGQVLYEGKRPAIALVIAQGTKTQGDFEDGLRSARTAIDFKEIPVTFTQTQSLCNTLRSLDGRAYTAIAIYRGGGIDPNVDVDKLEVLEVVARMNTPFISGVGHHPEQIFLRQIADAWTATPQGLGQFFSDIVEDVAAKRNNSRAVLVKQVEQQFKDQIEAGKKQNKELQERLAALTKQTTEFNATMKKMQEANSDLQKSIGKLTAENTQSAKALNEAKDKARELERLLEEAQKKKGCASGCLGMVVTAIGITTLACGMILMIVN